MSSYRKNNDNKMLVPWFNRAEWCYVYDMIYSDSDDRNRAVEIIKLWKLRVPKLPSGVEGTLIILEALLQNTDIADDNLRLLYGTSIMRFLNICGAYTDKQESFYKTAKKNKLPDWLIDLRNDLAHDQKIPSECVLKLGLEYCLNWLKTTYWDEQKDILMDYTVSEENLNIDKLRIAVPLYCKLNDLRYLYPQNNTIEKAMGPNNEICKRLSVISNLNYINPKTNIDHILIKLFESIKDIIRGSRNPVTTSVMLDSFLGENPPVSFIRLQQSKNEDLKRIPLEILKRWKNYIEFLHKENILIDFIRRLFEKCNSGGDSNTRYGASLWISEILKNLQYNYFGKNYTVADTESEEHFNFSPLKPDLIENLKTLQDEILSNPNEYSLNFVETYLTLLQHPQEFVNDTLAAIRNYTIPKTKSEETGLHSIEEFEEYMDDITASAFLDDFIHDMSTQGTGIENNSSKKWKLVKDTSIFEGCPLGVLTYQTRENNPLLTLL